MKANPFYGYHGPSRLCSICRRREVTHTSESGGHGLGYCDHCLIDAIADATIREGYETIPEGRGERLPDPDSTPLPHGAYEGLGGSLPPEARRQYATRRAAARAANRLLTAGWTVRIAHLGSGETQLWGLEVEEGPTSPPPHRQRGRPDSDLYRPTEPGGQSASARFLQGEDVITLSRYGGREGTGTFRRMTLEEAKVLRDGGKIWFISNQGDARRIKVNGRIKTWVRSPERIQIPVKYGLHEYGYFTESDIASGRVLVPLRQVT